jgi:hypothetical protein
MGFLGALEAVRYRTVYGWTHDSCQPQPPTVRIQINGVDAGIAVADLPRPELLEMGVTSFHRGFEWSVPESFSWIDSVDILTVDRSRVLPTPSEPVICGQTNRPLPLQWKSTRSRFTASMGTTHFTNREGRGIDFLRACMYVLQAGLDRCDNFLEESIDHFRKAYLGSIKHEAIVSSRTHATD